MHPVPFCLTQIEYVPSRRILYYELDQTNTPRAAEDATGKVVWRWESDAFGTTAANEDPDGDGVKTTVNLRFPGQYYDQESGLHYNMAREYDPGIGRYREPDPVGLAAGSNPYTYALNNPMVYTDPFGLDVNVCYFPEAAHGLGHVGFGLKGEISTQGFNPGLPFPFNVLGPGAVKQDHDNEKQCKTVESPPDKDKCMKRCRQRRFITPGTYNLFSRQCTSFVRDCLEECGLPSGSYEGPFPADFFKGLPNKK